MTALDTAPIAWAESDTRYFTTTIALAPSREAVEFFAARALITTASHPEAATTMVRAVRAAILVRIAELAAIDAAKTAGYADWFTTRRDAALSAVTA